MSESAFLRRVLIVLAIGSLAFAVWTLSDLLLLVFGSALTAVALRAGMAPVRRVTGLSEPLALLSVVLLAALVIALIFLAAGQTIASQARYLLEELPQAFRTLAQDLDLKSGTDQLRGSAIGELAMRFFTWSTTVFGAVASLVLVLVGGIYLANSPNLYRNGLIALFPERWQALASSTLDEVGVALHRWLRAQALAMAIVGTMFGIGMWIIGVPSPAVLGLIAGLTEFVPIVGPIVGAIPAVLLASAQGFDTVIWALAIAALVQQVENNVVMPLLVGNLVHLPAAVGLFATVAAGILFGPLGLLLGYPLTVAADVAVKRLYVMETLGKDVSLPTDRPP